MFRVVGARKSEVPFGGVGISGRNADRLEGKTTSTHVWPRLVWQCSSSASDAVVVYEVNKGRPNIADRIVSRVRSE